MLLHQSELCSVLYLLLKYFSSQLLLILVFFGGKNIAQNVISHFQALYVNPLDSYNIHWPIRRGQLNLHPGPGGSLTAVLADLEVIWSYAIQKYLEIPLKDLKVSCEQHIFCGVGCIHFSKCYCKREVVFLINTSFLLVSKVPKTSSGILSMCLRQKLLIEPLTRRVRNPMIRLFTVLVFVWVFFLLTVKEAPGEGLPNTCIITYPC